MEVPLRYKLMTLLTLLTLLAQKTTFPAISDKKVQNVRGAGSRI